jgi:hypothetical protein
MSTLSSPATLAFYNSELVFRPLLAPLTPVHAVYLNTLTLKSITILFARYCKAPWPDSLTKSERILAAIDLIRSDPLIAIDVRSHYDFTKQQKGLSPAQKQSLRVKAGQRRPVTTREQGAHAATEDPYQDYPYLHLPTPECMNLLLNKYIDHTGNNILSKRICGCCGQRDFSSEFHPNPFSFHDLPPGNALRLPGRHLLQPGHPSVHPHMTLFASLARGLSTTNGVLG